MINKFISERTYKKAMTSGALILFLLCLIPALSAPALAEGLDWEGAWKVIMENNPGLRSVRQSVAAARASMKLSALSTKVTTALSGTTTKEESDRSSSSAGVSISYNTSLFGREKAVIGAETAALREAEMMLDIATLNLYRNAAISFWGAAAGEASVRAGEDEIFRRQAFLADARLRYEQGMVPELDVMRAESSLAEARHSLALLEAKRSGFEAMLKGLAGWKDISPAGGLFDLDEEIRSRAAPPDFPSVADSHPSVKKARWAVAKAASLVKAAEMIPLPTLNLTATKTLVTDGGASGLYTQDDWWGRATLSLPMIDGGQARWTVARAMAGLASAEAALGAAKAEVMMNLFSAWEDHVAASKGLEAEQARFGLVSREREIVLLRYREGLVNQIEVLDAQTRFAGSLAALIDARRGLLVTEVSLSSAEGKIPGRKAIERQ
ncbi:MAG: TolC family protein [Thermovirgaceae bacterium]|nr:TolC family protein [Thermovirgaceae bacterium]